MPKPLVTVAVVPRERFSFAERSLDRAEIGMERGRRRRTAPALYDAVPDCVEDQRFVLEVIGACAHRRGPHDISGPYGQLAG